jgi:ABC-2 type transport system ATP-binding protein
VEVLPGEAVAIIGPNGAGKSTFLGCLTGDRIPDAGSVRICGKDPFSDGPGTAACLGFVPEQPFLYAELTVAEMLRFVTEVRSLDKDSSTAESRRLLELFGMAGAEGVLCRELSQGMGRKVAIVCALLHAPRLFILDEVFNGLDTPSTQRLIRELETRRENGASVLLSSHDLPLLASWCDRGLLLAPTGWQDLSGARWERWRSAPGLIPE